MAQNIDGLRQRVALDLESIEVPHRSWVPEHIGPDGTPVADVVIVGGGLSGLTIAFGLIRKGVTRIEVIDAASRGLEGPWNTAARMRTLRSPKWLSGPDLGVPSLTYRAWHEAQFGTESYAALDKIDRCDWITYLGWFRDTLDLPVINETTLLGVEDIAGMLCLNLSRNGEVYTRFTRRLVLATGIDGGGGPMVPRVISDALPEDRYTHSAAPFDAARLAGKRTVVLGAAASAFDWAVTALSAGADTVTLISREATMPTTEILDWSNFSGFLEHFGGLPAAERLKFTRRMLQFRNPPTQEMYDRALAHPRFTLRAGSGLASVSLSDNQVTLRLRCGDVVRADHLLLGTGYEIDLTKRPELAGLAQKSATWGDMQPDLFSADDDPLRAYPYLGQGFEMIERVPGTAPALGRIHMFNNAAVLSLGPICNGVTGLKFGVPRLVSALTAGFFKSDSGGFFDSLDRFGTRHFDAHGGG